MAHLFDAAKDRKTQVCLPSFVWGHTTHHSCPIRNCFLDMKSTLVQLKSAVGKSNGMIWKQVTNCFPSKSLTKDFGILVNAKVRNGIFIT